MKTDMPAEKFREMAHRMVDEISSYLENVEKYNVLSQVKPGDIKRMLPGKPPKSGDGLENIFEEIEKIIMPGVTHWNHPGFHAYFNSTSSGPGILAEMLSAAFNTNGMLWKSCPSSTELEETVLIWLREALGIPDNFFGIIYDTASVSSMHAIAAARESKSELKIHELGMSGRKDLPKLRIYCSEHAHSSIEKAALTLGFGLDGIKKIPVDSEFKMIHEELLNAIKKDKAEGILPVCVVATVGTTSTTSIDPVGEIAKICKAENIWLHVDAAHAGSAAIVPEYKHLLNGVELADSIVVNPHKWMFIPIDFSVLYISEPDILKRAFSLVPEYLRTEEDSTVINYMDYGIQLGRRFRSLKLWFVFKYFGTEGIAEIIREHLKLGKKFENWIDNHSVFKKLALVPLSTVCFRAEPDNIDEEDYDEFNNKLMNNINSTGKIFISHTVLNDKFTLRFVVSGIRTEERHVDEAMNIIDEQLKKLLGKYNG